MAKVVLTPAANQQMVELPRTISHRVYGVLLRLKYWPQVSGTKPLRHELQGHYRIRTGDYRILFRVVADEVWIVRIDHRKDVYED